MIAATIVTVALSLSLAQHPGPDGQLPPGHPPMPGSEQANPPGATNPHAGMQVEGEADPHAALPEGHGGAAAEHGAPGARRIGVQPSGTAVGTEGWR